MFAWLRRTYRRHRLHKAAQAVVRDRGGYGAHGWQLSDDLELAALTNEVKAWLLEQIGASSTPYGFSSYQITLWLTEVVEGKRQIRWEKPLPPFKHQHALSAIEGTCEEIRQLPYKEYPQARRLEVLIISLGDIYLQAADRLGM